MRAPETLPNWKEAPDNAPSFLLITRLRPGPVVVSVSTSPAKLGVVVIARAARPNGRSVIVPLAGSKLRSQRVSGPDRPLVVHRHSRALPMRSTATNLSASAILRRERSGAYSSNVVPVAGLVIPRSRPIPYW